MDGREEGDDDSIDIRTYVRRFDGLRALVAVRHVKYQALIKHNPIRILYQSINAEGGKAAPADDDDDVDLFGDDDVSLPMGGSD